ncbi:MAG: type IV pilus secretin PilQ, partial [Myxococcales bacterium]|nr:type IV pilus secretin PilQ [Myxococcales bacterium]
GQKTREALSAAEARAHSAESTGRKTREALSAAEARASAAESARRKTLEALSAAEARLATLSHEKDQAAQRVARLEKELSTARRSGDDDTALERELADARTARARLERSMDDAERTLAEVTRERDAARKDARAAESRATTAEKAQAKAGEALAAANAKLETLGTEREEAVARVARLEADVASARKAGSGTSSLARELDEARREQERLEKSVASLKRAARDVEAERDVARQDADAAVKATSVAQRRADEAKKDAETAKADLRAAKARITRLQADAEAADERVAAVEKQLKSAQARGGNTSALTAELEGAKSDLARAHQELKAERSEREAIRKEASAEVARLEADKQSLEKDLAEAKRSGRSGGDERLAATLEAKEAEIAALTSQLATARSHAGAAEELARVVAESEKARADLQKAQERISSLEKERTLDKSTAQVESALTRITNVAFHEKNNVSRVEIELDGKAGYEIVEKTDQKMVLVVDKARIPKLLERRLDTRDFYGPVATVSSFTDPDDESKVRVVVELNEAVKNQVTRRGNALVWEFYNGQRVHMGDRAYASADDEGRSGVQFRPSAVGGERSEPFGSAPPVGGVTLPGGGGGTVPLSPQAYSRKRSTGRKYKGQKINLSIKDADIQQVLTFLAREGGVNIVTGQAVQGTVTVHLKDVPWDLALDMVLKSQGLDYVEEDGVYRVALAEAIRTEFEAEVEKRKKMNELRQLVVKLVSVNYADAEQISAQVKGVLSEKGTVTVDARTNTLIIKDVEEHVLAGEDIVRRLDTQTPQVLIEARIVEASSNFTEDIGIQWGGNYTASPAFGNETGLVFPAIVGFSGAADDSTSPVTGLLQDQPKFAVNLPAAVGAGSGGGIALTLGSLTGAGNLNLRLTAAEERGQLKIISSPRIATLDNNQATIRQGISIPISVVSSLGVNTQFFNAELALQVTPQVTQDGNVNLAVNITKNEPNFSQTGANGNPTIERKEATTQLLVRDGDTAVIGGIYTRNASQDFKKVPVLADIPFLGWLFKNRTVVDKRTELILFITPRII